MKEKRIRSAKSLFAATVCAGMLLAFFAGCRNAVAPANTGGGTQPSATPKSSEKKLLEFKLEKAHNPGLAADVIGTIDEVAKNITLTVPYGTDVTKLKPTFTASNGASVFAKQNPLNPSGGYVLQRSTVTENNFTYPFHWHKVVAEDGSKQEYMVQIEVVPASGTFTGKKLVAFDFKKDINPELSEDVLGRVGTIRDPQTFQTRNVVFIQFPIGTTESTIRALKPSFTASYKAKVTIGGTELISAQTVADFYNLEHGTDLTVTAQDGGTTPYNVAIEIDLPTATEHEAKKYLGSYYANIGSDKVVIVLEYNKVTLYSTSMSMDYVNVKWEKKNDGTCTCTTYKKGWPQIKNMSGKGGYVFTETGSTITVKTNIMGGDVTATKGPDFTWTAGSGYNEVSVHI